MKQWGWGVPEAPPGEAWPVAVQVDMGEGVPGGGPAGQAAESGGHLARRRSRAGRQG